MESSLLLEIHPQPDGTTCGPTCLQAVYRFYGDPVPLERVVAEVPHLEGGGTLGVLLACHALRRGYRAFVYTYNLGMFDPTWFRRPHLLPERLRAQAAARPGDAKLRLATDAYLEFLSLGGKVYFRELTPKLLRKYLKRRTPLLTGLSSTYLYGCAREHGERYDDVRGSPQGHFVVVSGYDRETRSVSIADPLQDNPKYGRRYYTVGIERLLGAILLGIVTYDANVLVLKPRVRRDGGRSGGGEDE